jgi:hypothetical protein
MNLDDLQRKLISAARANPPTCTVPFGFERRIISRIKESGAMDFWGFWAKGLWRAAAPCVALALFVAAWSLLSGSASSSSPDLSQELENTVMAAANPDQPVQPVADSTR